jgi:probable HAF family extracellular repeat protein
MMISIIPITAVQKRWKWCLVGLCSSGLLACGGSGSDPATPKDKVLAATMSTVAAMPAAAEPGAAADLTFADAAAAHGRYTTYSVVKLGSGEITELPAINSRNQVAFSQNGAKGPRATFFDGATVRDIGTLGGAEAYAPALNDAGQVAGYSSNPSGNYHAFRWSKTSGMVDLGTLSNASASKGLDINRQGQVVGYSDPSLAPLQAFIWSDMAGMADLGRLGTGLGSAVAQVVNDAGTAAGFSDAPDGNAHGFVWTPAGGMVDLGTVGGIDSYATLINNAGQIAGYSAVNNANGFNYHGFVWNKASGMLDIGTLSGLGSAALAMNSAGQVAGVSDTDGLFQHAIFWTRAGGLVDLGTLGGTSSRALGINKYGVVVGWSNTSAGQFDYRAFLWTKAQGMVDLNTRIPRAPAGLLLTAALAISDTGAIVADSNAGLVLLKPGARGTDAPVVGPISPADPVAVGTRVGFSASFTDQNVGDTHKATWSWGDHCAAGPGIVTESHGVGTVRGDHTFCKAGVYPVTLTVTDNTGISATAARDVVVYDPSASAVSGGGWFMSPQGAYAKEKVQAGRATFSFVSNVANHPARPGEMTLRFQVANLDFRSAAYDAMSVAGLRAQYQGSGKINGTGNYKFLMTVADGTVSRAVRQSRFRIKIWHIDARTNAEVVDYDNQAQPSALVADSEGSIIGGGSLQMGRHTVVVAPSMIIIEHQK